MRKRIEYTYNSGGSPVWSSETHYIYDGNRVIQERDTNNAPTISYTRGTDLSGRLEGRRRHRRLAGSLQRLFRRELGHALFLPC